MFELVDREVTVISTTHIMVLGVLVMVKVLLPVLEVLDSEKKVVAEPSCLAVTSIFTPFDGMAEVMVTIRGKSGPGAGASTLLLVVTGEVCTVSVASEALFTFFWQAELMSANRMIATNDRRLIVFIFSD